MREFNFAVTNDFDGRDIKFILKNYWGLSDNLIKKLKKDEGILLNGKNEFVVKKVRTGDILCLNFIEEGSPGIIPEDIPISILYEDDDILAVNKPGNMPTHPSIGHFGGTLANAVMYYFKDASFTFRAVTRLDRDTSGVVIIAKNAPCCHRLSKQLISGDFKKEYVALCVGAPDLKIGRINAPIMREKEGIIKRCINSSGKTAITDYEVIGIYGEFSMIRLFPKTGRTHQLRLHLSHIGTPIFADFLYGEAVGNERIRLHAECVTFIHPFSGKEMKISAPIPDDMNPEMRLFPKIC